MKTVDYKSLLQQHKPKGYVSADANQIANRLICELSIQSGYGLARFLEMDVSLDNHMAVRVWVQGRLDDDCVCNAVNKISHADKRHDKDIMFTELRDELLGLVPASSVGF